MTTEVSTKVVKVDFKEIIDKCLDKKFWEKKWLIFEYDDYEISVRLNQIDISYGSVDLYMRVENAKQNIRNDTLFWLPLDQYNETVFRKKLLSHAHYLIREAERILAMRTDEYDFILREEQELQDQQVLELEAFLDSEGVENLEIREAYIKQNKKEFNDKSKIFLLNCVNNNLIHVHNMIDVMIEFEGEE